MHKGMRILVFAFLVFTVYFGLGQLSDKNNIFADTMAPCCLNGQCDGLPCSYPSSVMLDDGCAACHGGPTCREYILTCWDCMEYIGVCDQPVQQCIP